MKRFCIFLSLLFCLSGCATGEEPGNHEFLYRDVTIAIDSPAEPVIEALGAPKSYTEEASCAFDGLDKTYQYDGFCIATYPKDGVDRIARIWFSDGSVSTNEGLSIGSGKADAEKIYGTFSDNTVSVVQGSSKLTIILEADVVTSIQYALLIE